MKMVTSRVLVAIISILCCLTSFSADGYAANNAQFISQSVPTSLSPGETAMVTITMKNTGTSTWTEDDLFRLGTQNPAGNTTWGFVIRASLTPGESITPGQQKTFQFPITAPSSTGSYDFQMQMVQENLEWFGDLTTNIRILIGVKDMVSLEDLFKGKASFVQDQPNVPLVAQPQFPNMNFGHREAFAVNRIDIAPNTIYLYHRCFIEAAEHPEICLSISNDGGKSYNTAQRVITRTGNYSVAPSVLKIGDTWWMVWEEGDKGVYYAESADGVNWVNKKVLIANASDPSAPFPDEDAATPSLYQYEGNVYVYYATFISPTTLKIRYRMGPSLSELGQGMDLFYPDESGWGTVSVSMPRVVRQNKQDGSVVHYLFFEGGTVDYFCEASTGNEYGWGIAMSYDLINWIPYDGNPIMINNGGCGLDMPQPFIRYDNRIFVYHTSEDTRSIVREKLAFICKADINNDTSVNSLDFSLLIAEWGRTDCSETLPCEGDLNKSNSVNIIDYIIMLTEWGRTDCQIL